MTTIDRIEITRHRLPLDPPFIASWDGRARTYFDATIVRVFAGDNVGIGSGDTMLGFEGHEDLFIGQDPLQLERHARVIDQIGFHYGRCWPLDIALWDLAGKLTGQPCWKLIGGLSGEIDAYASSGTLRAPDELSDVAERFAEQGFRAMKIRFQRGDWREDIKALEAVRARVCSRLELMVDCNQGWRMPWDTQSPWSLKDAIRVARELEQLDVFWMEEPLHRADRNNLRRLRESVDVRISGGEMNRELYEFRDLITEGCFDVIQPDAALVGGLTGLRKIAHMAQAHGVVFTPHTWTNGVGVVANAHLTAGTTGAPFLEFPIDPPEWSLDRRDFMMSLPFKPDTDGVLRLGDAPGLGITLDEDRLAATRV